MGLVLGHVATGSRELHHWVYQILAILIIVGVWFAFIGYVERRRARGRGAVAFSDYPVNADERTGPESPPYVSRPSKPGRHSPRHRGSRR